MKNVFVAAVLLIPFAANAGSIDLGPNAYWQVQKASNFETLCEGFITQCEVEPGLYNVINLTTGVRQEGVIVAPENQLTYSKPEIVKNVCDWTSEVPLTTDISIPDALLSYGVLGCEVSCPVGKVIVGTIECSLSSDQVGSDFLIPEFIPTTLTASENDALCRASTDVYEGESPRVTTVTIACQ